MLARNGLWRFVIGALCVAPAASLWGAAGHIIAEGSTAPPFELPDRDGTAVSSGTLAGRVVLVCFVRPEQDRSVAALRDAALIQSGLGTTACEFVAIVSGAFSKASIDALIGGSGFQGKVLLDATMVVYGSYGVIVTPSTVLIARDGKISFSKAGYDFEFESAVGSHVKFAVGLIDAPARDRLIAEGRAAVSPHTRAARLCGLARSLREGGKLDPAESLIRKALEEDASSVEARLELADILLLRSQPDKALAEIEKIPEQGAGSGPFRLVKGRVLWALGRREEAEAEFRLAAKLDPRSGLAHYELGKLYENLGKKNEAIAELKLAVEKLLARPR